MALTVSITNMKGGVGKTTLTANLGYCLSSVHKKKVLIVDVDPQFNLTQYCMDEKEYEKILLDKAKATVFNIFIPEPITIPLALRQKQKKNVKTYVYKIRENLFLIPSSMDLIDFIDQRRSGSERLLSNFIDPIKNEYDFILIDCPPTSTILSRAAYLSSEAYLIPMGMDYFSVMGIPLLQKDINNFTQTYGKELKGIGIIRTKYLDWTRISRKHKDIVEKFAEALNIRLFESSFKQRQDVQNALSDRKFILEHDKRCDSAADIIAITKEFLDVTSVVRHK